MVGKTREQGVEVRPFDSPITQALLGSAAVAGGDGFKMTLQLLDSMHGKL